MDRDARIARPSHPVAHRTPSRWQWTAGFDIIYAGQDYAFDVHSGLYSVPRQFGIAGALWISRALHLGMLVCLIALVHAFALGAVALAGVAAVAALLAWEHRLVRADDLSRIDAAFFTMNGYVSVIFFVFWATDIFSAGMRFPAATVRSDALMRARKEPLVLGRGAANLGGKPAFGPASSYDNSTTLVATDLTQ